MPRIIPVPWQKFEKFLLSIGCVYKRQKGSHRIYIKTGLIRPVILPTYKRLPIMVIKNNLRTLGISPKEYFEILEKL